VISPAPHKRLAVDIGGTFTDVVVEAGAQRWTRKVLTTPQAPDQAAITGTLELLAEIGIAPGEISLFIHGTTLATNAIIERKGAVTVLIATEGFRDILDIADEGRYDQYDIFIDKPVALVAASARSWPKRARGSRSPSPARSVPRCANTSAPRRRWPTPMSSRSSPDI
jgi:N-methylhydantoinase A/oxoprolinase/acetone carboxylase beta subunit